MVIYQGIQQVFAHVVQLINSVTTWFSEFVWADMVEAYPIGFQLVITNCIMLIVTLSIIGLVKKLSFMLG